MTRHPFLGPLGALDLHDIYLARSMVGARYEAAKGQSPALCAWWAGVGMLITDTERLLLCPDLTPKDLEMLTLQLEADRDEAARAHQPVLADLFADALCVVVDLRDGAGD